MKITVLGDGGWGTAQAILLAGQGHEVSLWSAFQDYAEELARTRENRKFLPGVKIPKAIRITADLDLAVRVTELLVVAVPSRYLRGVVARLNKRGSWTVVSAAKGIETGSLKRMSEVIEEVLGPVVPVAVLSGPSHAEEVARGIPTAVVAASINAALAKKVQGAYACERFRVFLDSDVVGVELGGALKNMVAIACGIIDGLGLGTNTKSAIVSLGLSEMTRLGEKLGAKRSTFYGLAGVGDLMTTCFSEHSRNLRVGRELGQGRTLKEISAQMEMVAEGIQTTQTAVQLARREGVEMPVAEALNQVLEGSLKPMDAILRMMCVAG